MKILLVAPYKASFLGSAKFPPIGLGYLASSLRKKGHEVKIIDCLKDGIDEPGYRRYLLRERPQLVGLNSWSCSVKESEEMLSVTKDIDTNIVTVVGGPHPSAVPGEAMEFFKNADFGFRGEAEIGFPQFIDSLSEHKSDNYPAIPGLIWKDNGRWIANEQIYYANLDELGFPAWDLIRPEEYSHRGTVTADATAPIITSRGCPYQCTFCSAHIISGYKIRTRSVEDIINEIKLLKEQHRIEKIAIMDENFTFKREHVVSFCNRVIEEKLDMTFYLPQGARLDTLDEDILLLMKKAGFSPHIALGIESGSERILKMIKKGLNKQLVKDKVRLLRKSGFRPVGYFILGFPTETKQEMYETLAFAKELKLYRAAFSPLLILPNTEIHRYLVEKNEMPGGYDFSLLVTDMINYAPKGLTLNEFSQIRKDILLKFNLQPRVLFDYMRDWNSFAFAIIRLLGIFFRKNLGRNSNKEKS